jgi:sec-independent protein translocase protein TatA
MAKLALFNLGGEIILILAVVLILFGAKKLPELARGLGEGISRFRDALDDTANDAGRSVGGIFGKRAAQAITPDNQVAELYTGRRRFTRSMVGVSAVELSCEAVVATTQAH